MQRGFNRSYCLLALILPRIRRTASHHLHFPAYSEKNNPIHISFYPWWVQSQEECDCLTEAELRCPEQPRRVFFCCDIGVVISRNLCSLVVSGFFSLFFSYLCWIQFPLFCCPYMVSG